MNFDANRSIWLQLWEELIRQTVIGRWTSDKRVPGVQELAVELGVNPNVVQRTLVELECDDLCRLERAVGRFIADDAERVSRLQRDLMAGMTDEFIARMKSFDLPEAEAVALIAEGWNQQ